MPINKNGYLYVYVSNETPNIDVYFDNLQVTHIRGPLLSENHYYGGNELDDDESINLYSTFFRKYDPQIGRFNGVDIMSEKSFGLSVYQFALNNPISHNDPLGNFMHTPTQFYGEYYDKYMSMNSLEHMTGIGGGLFDPNNGGGGGGGVDYSRFWQNVWNSVPTGTDAFWSRDGKITPTMAAAYFSSPGVGDVSATEVDGGFTFSFTVNSTGTHYDNTAFLSTEHIANNLAFLSDLYGNEKDKPSWVEASEKISFGLGFSTLPEQGGKYITSFYQANGLTKSSEALGEIATLSKFSKVMRWTGMAGEAISIGTSAIQLYEKPTVGNFDRLAVHCIATAFTFVPVVGWAIALGIEVADFSGAFDDSYKQQ